MLDQDTELDSQTALERKTLRRAFYSRETKNQIDDEDEGRTPLPHCLKRVCSELGLVKTMIKENKSKENLDKVNIGI